MNNSYLVKNKEEENNRNSRAKFSKLVKRLLLSSIISGISLIPNVSIAESQKPSVNIEGEHNLDYRLEHGLLEESGCGLFEKVKDATCPNIQAAKNWYYNSLGLPTPAPGYVWINPGNKSGDFRVKPVGTKLSTHLSEKIRAKTKGFFDVESFDYFLKEGIPFGYVYRKHIDGAVERDGKKQFLELEEVGEERLKNNNPIIFEAYLGKIEEKSYMKILGPDKKEIDSKKLDPSCGCHMGRCIIPKGAEAGDYTFSVYTEHVVLCSFPRSVFK